MMCKDRESRVLALLKYRGLKAGQNVLARWRGARTKGVQYFPGRDGVREKYLKSSLRLCYPNPNPNLGCFETLLSKSKSRLSKIWEPVDIQIQIQGLAKTAYIQIQIQNWELSLKEDRTVTKWTHPIRDIELLLFFEHLLTLSCSFRFCCSLACSRTAKQRCL